MAVTATTLELKATLQNYRKSVSILHSALERTLGLLDDSEITQLEVRQSREKTDELSNQLEN